MRKTLLMTTMLVSSLAVAGSALAADNNTAGDAGTKMKMTTGAQGDGDGTKLNPSLKTDGTATGSAASDKKMNMTTGAQGDGDGTKLNPSLKTEGTATGSAAGEKKMQMTTGAQGDGDGTKTNVTDNVNFKSYTQVKGFKGAIAGGYSAEELMGTDIIGPDGNTIGEIDDLLIDANNQVSRVLVDVGGFLGIGEKKVAMELSELSRTKEGFKTVETEAQLESRVSYVEQDDSWLPFIGDNSDKK
jgi:sporulation protein YlmC with PRC-barrel domain